VIIAALSLAAALLPAWGFLRVLPPIEEVYNHPIAPGWGFWLSLGGFGAAAVVALAGLFGVTVRTPGRRVRPDPGHPPP
jgi:hypothetical protein